MNRIQQIQGFLQESPNDSFLNHALALEFIKINDLEKAQIIFEKILTDNPNYLGSYYHLAKLLEQTNQPKLAELYYKKGMDLALLQNDKHSYNELKSAYEEFIF